MQACTKRKKKKKERNRLNIKSFEFNKLPFHQWVGQCEDIPVIAKEPCYLIGFLVQGIDVFSLKDQGVPEVQAIGFTHSS
jgi:hypothetical protein